jgi:hypothetical protein
MDLSSKGGENNMTFRAIRRLAFVLVVASAVSALLATSALAEQRQAVLSTVGSPQTPPAAPGAITGPEFPGALQSEGAPDPYNGIIDRSLSRGTGKGVPAQTGKKAKSKPTIGSNFEGLNFFQQRFANNGNQFSVEPPDQALCVGNGYVVEAVNDVMNVFDSNGNSLLPANSVGGAVDLNTFYGYRPAIVRASPLVYGPELTDPSCLYDAQTQRFYMIVLTLDRVGTTSALTHVNHLDIAVSQTSNPAGAWNIYKIDVTNDGSNPDASNACPCLGDYPHIGADANGFYVTTNSYTWAGHGFDGAQIYALSKAQLAAGSSSVNVVHIDTFGMVNQPSDAGATQPGFTVWPAQSPGTSSFDQSQGGTEYFLSSNAADEATHPVRGTGGTGTSNQLVVWALTGTASLNSLVPSVSLSNTVLTTAQQYGVPPKATQPGSGSAAGTDVPLGRCINDTTTLLFDNATTGCWKLLFGGEPSHTEIVSKPDSNDTRMQQVDYANGKLWGALDTAVTFGSGNYAGVGWYIVKPSVATRSLTANFALQGTYGVSGSNLTYPAIGVTASGRGVMAMTQLDSNTNPSAVIAPIDASAGVGELVPYENGAGAAPDDGFTSYKAEVGNPPRTRWGDYGAAAVDGNSIWVASEYIAHACDYTKWGGNLFAGGTGTFGICGGTRGALGNWSTRVTQVTP